MDWYMIVVVALLAIINLILLRVRQSILLEDCTFPSVTLDTDGNLFLRHEKFLSQVEAILLNRRVEPVATPDSFTAILNDAASSTNSSNDGGGGAQLNGETC